MSSHPRIFCRWLDPDIRTTIVAHVWHNHLPPGVQITFPEFEVTSESTDEELLGRDWLEWEVAVEEGGFLYPEVNDEAPEA
ncbi:MAG: hypothetical protein O2894_03695 [Planctomycetota bacterium]|nr:hypothetical protein [Planctomycetota bacterium]